MTVLSIAQYVGSRVGVKIGDALYGVTTEKVVDMRRLVERGADEIFQIFDWELLQKTHTITGDGSDTDFDFPSDYDRMLLDAKVYSSSLEAPLFHVKTYDEWLNLEVQDFDFVINAWNIHGGQMHIKPALATGVTAKFIYVSNLWAADSGGTPQNGFSADTDTFRLDRELLELWCIWKFKAENELDFAQDFGNYEARRDQITGKDAGGQRVLRVGKQRMAKGARLAYPQTITG